MISNYYNNTTNNPPVLEYVISSKVTYRGRRGDQRGWIVWHSLRFALLECKIDHAQYMHVHVVRRVGWL